MMVLIDGHLPNQKMGVGVEHSGTGIYVRR